MDCRQPMHAPPIPPPSMASQKVAEQMQQLQQLESVEGRIRRLLDAVGNERKVLESVIEQGGETSADEAAAATRLACLREAFFSLKATMVASNVMTEELQAFDALTEKVTAVENLLRQPRERAD
uniref:Uncharacterized protein n=1 Tax=Chromera velia CCMP2878 TaxID=1169474 RepID=A0A0G4G231_9ALVE|eukprot:Cvel_19743.t1-p1 / transcript=Cvel_19743.t1 / gene=Cvel_19743 / organism=Chromera_velia_CCMP2878 / gene_product=hypothetical protein / transcript_product=hypothetical protein / location=Cvel_scaffold1727:38709-39077(+) / protein_length=123 / sequence_SO=supercontig / SO=protein_coding / is_pseudo=false